MLSKCYYCDRERSCERCTAPKLTIDGTDAVTLAQGPGRTCTKCLRVLSRTEGWYMVYSADGNHKTVCEPCYTAKSSVPAPPLPALDPKLIATLEQQYKKAFQLTGPYMRSPEEDDATD